MGQGEQEARSQIQHSVAHICVATYTCVRTLRSNFCFGFCFGSWANFLLNTFLPSLFIKKKNFFGCIFNNLNIKSVRIQPLKGLRRAADADGSSGQQRNRVPTPGSPCLGLPSNPHLEGTGASGLPHYPPTPFSFHQKPDFPATATTTYPDFSASCLQPPTQPALRSEALLSSTLPSHSPRIGTSLCQRPGVGSTPGPVGFQGDRANSPGLVDTTGGPGEDYEVLLEHCQ